MELISNKEENKINLLYKELEKNELIIYSKNSHNELNEEFQLNDTEKKCFEIIMNIINKNNLHSTICRVAGGWVRDKLLGRESIDIDIALNNIKGSQIATLINEELYPGKDKVGIIQQNSEKGKHLETATIKICDVWIDFVNLRSAKDDVMGTPLEDAERRDLSINSLFYNINDKKVEDWTKKGKNDLLNGIIETPIDPEITFNDDPLRILRMLRFALKYKFLISNNINNCLEKNIEKYRYHFNNTIANERIEKELSQILNMNNSSFVICYLYQFNLLDVILQPQKFIKEVLDKNIFLKTTNIFIIGIYLLEKISPLKVNNNFNKINFGFLLLTFCFRKYKVKFGKENITVDKLILKEVFKTTNENLRENTIMNSNIDELIEIVKNNKFDRLTTGKIIRKIHNNNLIIVLYAAIAIEYVQTINFDGIINSIEKDILDKIIVMYKSFYEYIEKENLFSIDELKPLLDGKEIIQLLNIKPSKEIGNLLELLLEEQIKEPKFTKEFAITFLNKKKEEIGIDNKRNSSKGKKSKRRKK